MRKKTFNKLITRVVYAEEEDFKFLKQERQSISGFFRDAVKQYREKKNLEVKK